MRFKAVFIDILCDAILRTYNWGYRAVDFRPVSRRRISGLAAEKSSAEYQPWKIRLAGLAAGKSQPNISCKIVGGRKLLSNI